LAMTSTVYLEPKATDQPQQSVVSILQHFAVPGNWKYS
jgi:hypothetical protein